MPWVELAIAVVVLVGVALLASGLGSSLTPAWPDRPDLAAPAADALTPADLDAVRLGVGFRGYRMDEVDELLDRVAAALAERDARIAALTPAEVDEVAEPERYDSEGHAPA